MEENKLKITYPRGYGEEVLQKSPKRCGEDEVCEK